MAAAVAKEPPTEGSSPESQVLETSQNNERFDDVSEVVINLKDNTVIKREYHRSPENHMVSVVVELKSNRTSIEPNVNHNKKRRLSHSTVNPSKIDWPITVFEDWTDIVNGAEDGLEQGGGDEVMQVDHLMFTDD